MAALNVCPTAVAPARSRVPRDSGSGVRVVQANTTLVAGTADTLPDPGFLLPAQSSRRPTGWRLALQRGFKEAIRLTRAEVGLLHVCGEAFLFTVAVHGLDPDLHMHIGVSFWDDAMQHVLKGGAVLGAKGDSAEAGSVARRLRASAIPEGVLAVPVMFAGQIEAVLELGRHTNSFRRGDDSVAIRAMRGSLQTVATSA
jgi:hypothetical protein